jgi:hypothetical protein
VEQGVGEGRLRVAGAQNGAAVGIHVHLQRMIATRRHFGGLLRRARHLHAQGRTIWIRAADDIHHLLQRQPVPRGLHPQPLRMQRHVDLVPPHQDAAGEPGRNEQQPHG